MHIQTSPYLLFLLFIQFTCLYFLLSSPRAVFMTTEAGPGAEYQAPASGSQPRHLVIVVGPQVLRTSKTSVE